MLAFWIVLGCLAFAAVGALIYSYVFYRVTFLGGKPSDPYYGVGEGDSTYSPEFREQIRALVDEAKAIPCEICETVSFDGLKLSARYYHTRDGAPLALMCHGYRGVSYRDHAGGLLLALSEKQNVLLIDERAHGESEGKTITFGVKERRDVLSWVNYALERFGPDQKIVLYGISMGAATVLMSVGLGLPGAVRGIVADCPYSSPAEIIDIVERRMKIPRPLRLPFAELSARLFGNFSLYAASAAEAVSHNERVPILLIHGEEDTLVPAALSKKIAESDPEHIRYLTFPGAEHGVSFLVDRPRYCKEVLAFSREVTEENEKTTESSE